MTQLAERIKTSREMQTVNKQEYRDFTRSHETVRIENTEVKLVKNWKIAKFQPEKFIPEEWTVWSFPDRGDWATHVGN